MKIRNPWREFPTCTDCDKALVSHYAIRCKKDSYLERIKTNPPVNTGKTRFKKGQLVSLETRRKLSATHKGAKSHLWRGGVTEENHRLRNSFEYKLWRVSVFERDNFTCQLCGIQNGKGKTIYLQADHIKPWAYYKDLRFDVSNGRTLCRSCHMSTDTFAGKIRHYVAESQ